MDIDKRLTLKALGSAALYGPLAACSSKNAAGEQLSNAVTGMDAGEGRLNGVQTTGRTYRNLSPVKYTMASRRDVPVRMRDGTNLMADVHRPDATDRFPVLIAASPYVRQLQDLGAPAGFIEAGRSDFFVPRGYVHVIANVRGTGGSGGTFGFFDAQERRDMHDLVEWAATQPWCNGNVGMIGISYFAMTQLEAAVEQPPHLKAIFPVAGTFDLYEGANHHGLASTSFLTPFLAMIGMTSGKSSDFYHSSIFDIARKILRTDTVHEKFETMNGEAAMASIKFLRKAPHDPHPWDDLWRTIVVERPMRDAWWEERNLYPLLDRVKIPVYLGCDWDNVPMHLPSTFPALAKLRNSPHVRLAMLGEHGLAWPWESLHIEALAWFDQWLQDRETGILGGPSIRYVVPEAGPTWRATDTWPPKGTSHRPMALCVDGSLADDENVAGSRQYLTLGTGLSRDEPSPADPARHLVWATEPLKQDLEILGDIELLLDAKSTATDTAWIAVLQDIDPDGKTKNVTAGYMRASMREVDEEESRTGAPVLPCRKFLPVPIGEVVHYRVPMVVSARRFKAGHRIQLFLASDDQSEVVPAMFGYRHASVGTSSINSVLSSSRLLMPVVRMA
jgi:uncharacterized protein